MYTTGIPMSGIKGTILLLLSLLYVGFTDGWYWKCISNQYCERFFSWDLSDTYYPTPEICRLVCGQYGALWPRPTGLTDLDTNLVPFNINLLQFVINTTNADVRNFLIDMKEVFVDNLKKEEPVNCRNQNVMKITLSVQSEDTELGLQTNESYSLNVSSDGESTEILITAVTAFGARHGLETLSQLITLYPQEDGSACLLSVAHANISDEPAFKHRGLLLDTSRNFLPVESLKRHIDGMASSKLNVMHWHATDTQSWPLEIPNLPNMTKYGAYGKDEIYSATDVADLVNYAKLRGVRVVLEIDAPSHSGNGWQWGEDAGIGPLAVCVNKPGKCIEVPCGQLNPANQNLYQVLQTLYQDVGKLIPSDMFHMGGDEIYIHCWNSSEEILKYIGNKPRTLETFLDLWGEYQAKALLAFDTAKGNTKTPIVVWSSDITNPSIIEQYLPKDRYIVQTWVPKDQTLPIDLIKLGYRVIISTKDAWYLDHGVWGSTKYDDWFTVYSNKLPRSDYVLGGEACMWGEYVDEQGVESRTWPRAAAVAERLWSDPEVYGKKQVESRFRRHRERLVTRGIKASTTGTQWCYQNEGTC